MVASPPRDWLATQLQLKLYTYTPTHSRGDDMCEHHQTSKVLRTANVDILHVRAVR